MAYSTGLPSLDAALGGLEGVVEIVGDPSCGKTTLCYHLLRRGGLYVVTEGDFDPTLAPGLVDEDKLVIARPRFGEAALETVAEHLPGRAVVDTASLLRPAERVGRRFWDSGSAGDRGRLLAYGANVLSDLCASRGGMVVFVHQYRRNLGAWFSGPVKAAYGKGTAAVASCRMKLTTKGYIRRRKRRIGVRVRVDVLANDRRPPGAEVWLDLIWGMGYRESASMLDLCVRRGVVDRQGEWYRLDGEVMGHGRDAACTWIEETEGVWRELKAAF